MARPGDTDPEAGSSTSELLALRLRVDGLERDLEAAQGALARRTAELDAIPHQRWWRAAERVASVQRACRPDVLVAAGYRGAGRGGIRIPLAGMPVAPGPGAPAVEWHDALTVGGVTLPGVLADPPAALRWQVLPGRGAEVRAFAALRPGAWTMNRGGVRFRITVLDAGGETLAAVERDVDAGHRSADRRWVPLTVSVPPGDAPVVVELSTSLPPGAAPDFSWGVWGDPVLLAGAEAVALPQGRAAVQAAARLRRDHRTTPAPQPAPADEGPWVSLLMPVHDPHPELLKAALDSVLAQTSRRWDLCIADDGSTDPEVRAILETAAADERVTLVRNSTAGGISAATNLALGVARGDYVATLDHDDLLDPEAIATVQAELVRDPATDVLYTDNDKVAAHAVRFAPALKPGWSPDLLRACMYTLHLGVYRRRLVVDAGGWRSAFDGAQDHDLVLRLSERASRVAHIPKTLYGWRAHAGSAALAADSKDYAYARGAAAISEHLSRLAMPARAERLPQAGRYRVVHEPPAAGTAAVVVPVPDDVVGPALGTTLATVVEGLRRRSPAGVDVAIVLGAAAQGAPLPDLDARVVHDAATAWGPLLAAGVGATTAEHLVLLEELCVPEADDWIAELIGPLREDAVVASSPLVLDEGGRVLHAGVALLGGLPLPVHAGADPTAADVPSELTMVFDRSAAAGVVALRRDRLAAAPLDPAADRHGLALLTATLTAAGGRVACSPHAPWRLVGRARTATFAIDELMRASATLGARADPFYNPRFWPDRADHLVPRALWSTGHFSEIDQV